jgi:dipeptidase
VCDTLCAIGPEGTLFAKNSDRQPSEVQLIEAHGARAAGKVVKTQYLEIPDRGAHALLGARPSWLWGIEHGVNEHRVAIGNEKVFTTLDPNKQPAGLIGMDLVRLGLERARSAAEALELMTTLLEQHGQGGVCDDVTGESYFSSFLIADPTSAWVLETSGRTWVAAPVHGSRAISNRLTIRDEWTRASADVSPGADWDGHRHSTAPTGHADVRLAASRACLGQGSETMTAAALASHLRDHGGSPWGAPPVPAATPTPPPESFSPDGTGVTVCMHIRAFQNTTSSMITLLPADPERPLRAWVAPGQPCASVFIPVFPPAAIPASLSDAETWRRFASLRDRVETDPTHLVTIRSLFDPVESELWREADEIADRPECRMDFVAGAWRRVSRALTAALDATGGPVTQPS